MSNNTPDRDFYFFGDFDESMLTGTVQPFIESATKLPASDTFNGQAPIRLNLWINSYGGQADVLRSALDGIAIAQKRKIEVATYVTGAAYSAGSMLAVAGTPGLRFMSRTASHLIHFGWTMADGTNPTELQRAARWAHAHFDFVNDHYAKHARVPGLRKKLDDDMLFVDFNQALRWGLADKEI